MRSHWVRWSRAAALLVAVATAAGLGLSAEPDPKVKKALDELEKVLPGFEKSADEIQQALEPLLASRSPGVRNAAENALLRIECIRSLRSMIALAPAYTPRIGEAHLQRWKEGAEYFLACARAESDPFKDMTSGIRACRSPIDGQMLFYVFRLPADYDPAQRYPLEIHLHAGAGLTWRAGGVDGKPSADPKKAEKGQHIWMSPCGRGNNCYAGMGDVAVVEALADTKKHYAVDADRVLIGGASMGGTGGFRLGALYPDLFAAAYSLTGGANYSVPVNDGRFDATLLVDNFCNTGLCIWDAPKEGWYKQNHAFADGLRERAMKYAGSYPHLELTDPNGGHGIIDRKLQDEGWQWLRKQMRNPYPKRVIYKTYSLRYDGAYWAHIDTTPAPTAPARIEAELGEGGKLRVAVENVDRFHLDLGKELVGKAESLEVSINGEPALKVQPGPHVYFALSEGKWSMTGERSPAVLVKKHGLSGPVQDVFMGEPVLFVPGKDRPKKMVDDVVEQLFGPGDGFHTLHTPFERKADQDVSPQDIAEKHLVLLGTPRENQLLARLAERLPVKFLDDGVEIASKAYRGEGVGVMLVYPNPLNPERYVLLLPENYVGGRPWTFADYLVVKPIPGAKYNPQQVLARGTFDARWLLPR